MLIAVSNLVFILELDLSGVELIESTKKYANQQSKKEMKMEKCANQQLKKEMETVH